MTEQKPMSTTDQGQRQEQGQQADKSEAQRKAEEGQKAYADAEKQMTDRHLFERIRAAHPHASQSAESVKAMLDDYKRLESEQQKSQGQGTHPQGGPPGQTGEHPQGGPPGQEPKPQPR